MGSHIRVSARGIVIHEGNILLNEFGEGEYYNLPGGGVEPGETIKQAVVREIYEEAGLNVTVGDLIYVLEYEPNRCDFLYGNLPHLSLVFRCYVDGSGIIKQPTIPDKDPLNPEITSRAKWIRISELKNLNYLPYIHNQLMEYIHTNNFSPVFIEEPLDKD